MIGIVPRDTLQYGPFRTLAAGRLGRRERKDGVSVCDGSGEFISPNGSVRPPLPPKGENTAGAGYPTMLLIKKHVSKNDRETGPELHVEIKGLNSL